MANTKENVRISWFVWDIYSTYDFCAPLYVRILLVAKVIELENTQHPQHHPPKLPLPTRCLLAKLRWKNYLMWRPEWKMFSLKYQNYLYHYKRVFTQDKSSMLYVSCYIHVPSHAFSFAQRKLKRYNRVNVDCSVFPKELFFLTRRLLHLADSYVVCCAL